MSVTSLKFLIADDHPLFRQGIATTLKRNFSECAVDEVKDGSEMQEYASQVNYDLIMTDICMPNIDGIQATKFIINIKPNSRVIAFSMMNDELHIKAMLESGVRGFISKEVGKDEMLSAIRSVLRGAIYISGKNLDENKWTNENDTTNDVWKKISKREKEVLQLICKGLSSKEIAEILFISFHTVENHRNHILEKLGLHNTASLVLYAAKNEWVA